MESLNTQALNNAGNNETLRKSMRVARARQNQL